MPRKPRKYLDPKLDIIFKVLFTDARNEALLVSLLESVLEVPIKAITVLDREIPNEHSDDKGVAVDIRALLEGGKQVHVEMQCDLRGHLEKRWLYLWSRIYGGLIEPGDPYKDLEPVVSIVFLSRKAGHRFHAKYALREVHDGTMFGKVELLELHMIDLPKLTSSVASPGLSRWVRFLRATTDEAVDLLAKEDPIMAQAKDALARISADPKTRALAEGRLQWQLIQREEKRFAREEGLAEGMAKGLAKGKAEGVLAVLTSRGLQVDEARRAQILACTDLALLHAWMLRAAVAPSGADVGLVLGLPG